MGRMITQRPRIKADIRQVLSTANGLSHVADKARVYGPQTLYGFVKRHLLRGKQNIDTSVNILGARRGHVLGPPPIGGLHALPRDAFIEEIAHD